MGHDTCSGVLPQVHERTKALPAEVEGFDTRRPALGEFERCLLRAQRKLERLARLLEKYFARWIIDEIDGVAFLLQELLAVLRANPKLLRAVRQRWARRSSPTNDLLRKAGALNIDVDPDAGGAVWIRIDYGRPFRLRPKLGALMAVLRAAADRGADDGFPRWTTRGELAQQLAAFTGHAYAPRRVTQLVSALRSAFESEDANPHLIETDGHDSVRLRLMVPGPEQSSLR